MVARAVSRYEPVIRWGLNNYVPVEWPETGPGVVPAEIAVRRLVTEDLQSPAFVADIPENLPVSLYGHAELIRFSYLLPSAGARSLLNVISAVRTGYQGVTTVFRYELRDHDKQEQRTLPGGGTVTVRPQGWDLLLGAMTLLTNPIHDPPAIAKPAPQKALIDARLMCNERMLTLRNMPYFYQYRLHARSQYEADFVRPTIALPPAGDHPARREPKILATRPPAIPPIPSAATSADVTIELPLTRTGDLLTPAEWSASPPLEPRSVVVNTSRGTATVSLSADQLPEPSMGYHFYYQVANSDIYVFVAELLMPWHPAYKLPPTGQPLRPWFRLMDSRASYRAERRMARDRGRTVGTRHRGDARPAGLCRHAKFPCDPGRARNRASVCRKAPPGDASVAPANSRSLFNRSSINGHPSLAATRDGAQPNRLSCQLQIPGRPAVASPAHPGRLEWRFGTRASQHHGSPDRGLAQPMGQI